MGTCWGQGVWWESETEQDSVVLAMSSACLLLVENFSQKISLIREVKNDEIKENSPRRLSSVQFSHSVVSDSLRPHEPQHARPPCPSPTPGVYPNPCPLSR